MMLRDIFSQPSTTGADADWMKMLEHQGPEMLLLLEENASEKSELSSDSEMLDLFLRRRPEVSPQELLMLLFHYQNSMILSAKI